MRLSKSEKAFNILNLIFMIFFVAIIALPLLNILALSFNDANDSLRGGIYFWPRQFSVESYKTVFENQAIYLAFGVSVLKTVVGVVLHTFVTAISAYALTREDLVGRKFYTTLGIFGHVCLWWIDPDLSGIQGLWPAQQFLGIHSTGPVFFLRCHYHDELLQGDSPIIGRVSHD
jgi:ABC-type sugar transport system permease subunit